MNVSTTVTSCACIFVLKLAGASHSVELGISVVGTLERLRDEREQVHSLLLSGHVHPDARSILEALLRDLDRQIDQELTRRLSPHSGSQAAD